MSLSGNKEHISRDCGIVARGFGVHSGIGFLYYGVLKGSSLNMPVRRTEPVIQTRVLVPHSYLAVSLMRRLKWLKTLLEIKENESFVSFGALLPHNKYCGSENHITKRMAHFYLDLVNL